MKPLVSIIIPVYNVEKYLDDCLSSIVSQSYDKLEIILVNDGSTDGSLNICNYWGEKDQRIKVFTTANHGLSHARNTGVQKSCGELIGFIDSDDFIDPNYVDKLVSLLEDNPDCAISTCCIQMYMDGKVMPLVESWQFEGIRYIEPEDFAERLMLMKSQHSSCGKLYKRELLDAVHYRDGFINEDILFCFDLIPYVEENKIRIVEMPDCLYYYRIRQDSTCHGHRMEMAVAEHKNMQIFLAATEDSRPAIYNHYYKVYLENTFYLLNRFLTGNSFDIPVSELRDDLSAYPDKYVKDNVKGIQFGRFLLYKYFFHIAYVIYGVKRIFRFR